MFLLVFGRHVGAHPDGHQHDVSIQISINLGKMFLRISCIRKITVTSISWRESLILLFLFSIFGLYLVSGFDFYSDLF